MGKTLMRIACVLVLFGIFAAVDLSAQEFPSAPKEPLAPVRGNPQPSSSGGDAIAVRLAHRPGQR
jgi:hypothetical protein